MNAAPMKVISANKDQREEEERARSNCIPMPFCSWTIPEDRSIPTVLEIVSRPLQPKNQILGRFFFAKSKWVHFAASPPARQPPSQAKRLRSTYFLTKTNAPMKTASI